MNFNKKYLVIALSMSLAFNAAAVTLTRDNGAPVGDNQNSMTAGKNGSVLLEDVQLIQKLQRFARERIPERVVHARGTGAHGVFVATQDFSGITAAAPFADKGKETPVFVRFSSVMHSKGSPETLRDPRGFATKFYTDEGNWDLVGLNMPVFFIRDAIKFPDMVHSLKPSPVTNIQDPNRVFDFFSSEPGSTHMLTWLYSDNGTPASYRKMDGFGVHAYKMINESGEVNYVKFHWKSLQGIDNLDLDEVANVQSKDFQHLTRDLYDSIAEEQYPQWDLYIKVMNPSDLNNFQYNPLDVTKMWTNIPETKVGTMTLNRMPTNFFQETEQVAMSPANLIQGIEPSEDRLLQGRIFSYSDTQMYRLGANHQQLPINRPIVNVVNYNQDGAHNMGVTMSDVNYQPSSEGVVEDKKARHSTPSLTGHVQQLAIDKQSNFSQAGELYRSFTVQEQHNLIRNLSGDLGAVKNESVKYTMLSFFYKADTEYGTQLTKAVNGDLAKVIKMAMSL
ncbi:catalase [Moritella viscosa]|uniref:Catalase n=1 Tax=Moritella viscosa TaxID=80854 RepID=A0A1L0ACI2_9GAMM|nr:catalase [Moritella viscosa]SGZ12093.1 Catalase [Moritella viscosa]SHO12665.1 Catalase [Moritella viscosa]SHO12666.1 Catalase [Moritella viscosa]SHO16689.1 Catalase [Moritella viscosa]SHO18443.1 Catalase [Moritella viscosa]